MWARACRSRAIIYSHTHGDHFGGVRGLITPEDVAEGRVEVIAPRDFMQFTISENVFAGNAMNRRLFYQYGLLLPSGQHGFVTQGLGHRVPAGATSLIAPTRFVSEDIEEFEVDGVPMVFQYTPNTEAPREMNTYIPEYKALWMAENVTAVLHNIYTLRGAQVRDSLNWANYINEALYLFGKEAEVMFASHHWPRWGNDRVREVLRDQRDMYANFNNQVLHYANQGVTINQIHNVYEMPASLQQKWHCRGYHGSPEHNSRGVIQRFLGFWDCNPATLIPLSPEDSAPLYVEMMGGAVAILARADELHQAGDYMLEVEILNKLVQAEPDNGAAKDMLADAFEQLGYQQENPGLRNSFLAAAYELRTGIPQGATADSSSPDVIRAMSTELFLNFLAIKMDSRRAEGLEFVMNLVTPDNGETLRRGALERHAHQHRGLPAEDADLTLTGEPRRPRDGDGGAATLRGAAGRRHGDGRGRSRDPRPARRAHGRVRPALRDHAPRRGRHVVGQGVRRMEPGRQDLGPGRGRMRLAHAARDEQRHMVPVLELPVQVEMEQRRRLRKDEPRLFNRLTHRCLPAGLPRLDAAARQRETRKVGVPHKQHLPPVVQRQKPHAKADGRPKPRSRRDGEPSEGGVQSPPEP
jgi:alkyl sulfatase BDS1-like metallo-beta-lactamase superfamily hydrolase